MQLIKNVSVLKVYEFIIIDANQFIDDFLSE